MYYRLRKALAGIALFSLTVGVVGVGDAARAQQLNPELRQNFLTDPLAADERDPLLPKLEIDRPFSPLELQTIATELDQLNNAALLQLSAGNDDTAFEQWLRELKLRRVLGTREEFQAIQRVASIAWVQQRPVEVQLLTLRTREIWDAVQQSLGNESEEVFERQTAVDPADSLISGAATIDINVLTDIAQTFTTLRDIDSAIEVYQQLIALSRTRGEMLTSQQQALAELHLSWFQFSEAANLYLTLLSKAREAGNIAQEIDYLEQLVYSYQQAESLTNAVRAQTDLVELYQRQDNPEKLPGLLVAIAQNYRTLNLPSSAIDYYRAAYSAAQRFDQFSFSAHVLQDLGALYESLAMTAEALGAYSLLVPVEQQTYNDYGTMNAHDKIGQLQRRLGNDFEALKAFERGLVLANRLNLREAYFIEQIESLAAADVPSL
ncbi:MAG: hypothetical protein AAFR12_05220 [Cyanobacteria bacterium J06626_6]